MAIAEASNAVEGPACVAEACRPAPLACLLVGYVLPIMVVVSGLQSVSLVRTCDHAAMFWLQTEPAYLPEEQKAWLKDSSNAVKRHGFYLRKAIVSPPRCRRRSPGGVHERVMLHLAALSSFTAGWVLLLQ